MAETREFNALAGGPESQPPGSRPLVVRLCNWVGEVVLSVPAMRRLETAGYRLHLFGKPWARSLLQGTGWPVLVHPGSLVGATRQLRALRRQIGIQGDRTRALLFTKSLSSALEARFAGYAAAGYAYDGRSLLLAQAFPMPGIEHAARSYWDLVSAFLDKHEPYPTAVGLEPAAEQNENAARLLKARGLAPDGFVMLCPFSGSDDRENRKVWPGYPALVKALQIHDLRCVICPGPSEEATAAQSLPDAIQFCGTDLGTYGALLRSARAVVANDTGPGHLAAAVGANLISIYGPYSIAAWAPLGPHVALVHNQAGWPDVAAIVEHVVG